MRLTVHDGTSKMTGRGGGHRAAGRRWTTAGFTLIEMLIVVALVGIVATLAMPSYKHATRKAREAVLKENLWILRDIIDQFYTDKARYPASLDELVASGYIRRVPTDPMTGEATWDETIDPLGEDEEEDPEEEQGITDVHSLAQGQTDDTPPIPYGEL